MHRNPMHADEPASNQDNLALLGMLITPLSQPFALVFILTCMPLLSKGLRIHKQLLQFIKKIYSKNKTNLCERCLEWDLQRF